jgi:NitT/TauT family transport system substrate-binding protein
MRPLSRRSLIAGATAALAVPRAFSRAASSGPLKLTFNAGAVCTSAAPVAVEKGFFKKS